MKKKTETKVSAIQCPQCGDIIFSRAIHDYRSCGCGQIFVDGGFDYMRVGYSRANPPELLEITVNATKKELYDDWNKHKDKFGLIRLGKKGGK